MPRGGGGQLLPTVINILLVPRERGFIGLTFDHRYRSGLSTEGGGRRLIFVDQHRSGVSSKGEKGGRRLTSIDHTKFEG